VQTARTPIFADSIWVDAWPVATDPPARNLYQGANSASMQRLTIARHGSSTAKTAPRNVPAGAPLPGAVTVEFADGHVELVNLEVSGASSGTRATSRRPSGPTKSVH
jgi:prepilin-type processing-associated H-X9-DG protein